MKEQTLVHTNRGSNGTKPAKQWYQECVTCSSMHSGGAICS
jgi:hypothetical protein